MSQTRFRTWDMVPEGRTCTVCGEWKPLAAFHKHRICRYGVEPYCKECKAQKRRERDARNPNQAKNVDLKAKYGITIEQYNAMFAAQEGRCAICGTAEEKLVVDHNHATGRVRSLLCHLCNAMIGCARESSDILVRAAAYLHAEQHLELGRARAEVAYVSVTVMIPATAASAAEETAIPAQAWTSTGVV